LSCLILIRSQIFMSVPNSSSDARKRALDQRRGADRILAPTVFGNDCLSTRRYWFIEPNHNKLLTCFVCVSRDLRTRHAKNHTQTKRFQSGWVIVITTTTSRLQTIFTMSKNNFSARPRRAERKLFSFSRDL